MAAETKLPMRNERLQSRQLSTFYLGDRLYGIDVTQVQEVTKPLPMTSLRLAPPYIMGLINLRGQIATAIGLRELFGLSPEHSDERHTVVCRVEGGLLSLLVDRIGDVVEVAENEFEPLPDSTDPKLKRFMEGVYKTKGPLLTVIGIHLISEELNQKN